MNLFQHAKISLFHVLIIRLAAPISDHAHLQNFQSSLNCINLYQHAKNSQFHQIILEIQSILKSRNQIDQNPYSDHSLPKKLRQNFNFCEFVLAFKNWGCFINLFWRNSWFKSPAIWLLSQPAFTCSKLTIEILEQGLKYVQS